MPVIANLQNIFFLCSFVLLITILYFVYFYLNDYKDKFNRIILVSLAILSLVFIVFFQMQEDSLVISSNLFLILIIYFAPILAERVMPLSFFPEQLQLYIEK